MRRPLGARGPARVPRALRRWGTPALRGISSRRPTYRGRLVPQKLCFPGAETPHAVLTNNFHKCGVRPQGGRAAAERGGRGRAGVRAEAAAAPPHWPGRSGQPARAARAGAGPAGACPPPAPLVPPPLSLPPEFLKWVGSPGSRTFGDGQQLSSSVRRALTPALLRRPYNPRQCPETVWSSQRSRPPGSRLLQLPLFEPLLFFFL